MKRGCKKLHPLCCMQEKSWRFGKNDPGRFYSGFGDLRAETGENRKGFLLIAAAARKLPQ